MTVKLHEGQKIKVDDPRGLYIIMKHVLLREKKIDRDKEHMWLVCLAQNNKILMIELISLGSVKSTLVEPMDVFSFALQKRAVKLMLVHNHPSGELRPSKADERVTERMMAIGRFIDMPIIDHLIISEEGYYSFATSGLLDEIYQKSNIDLTFKKQEAQQKQIQQHINKEKVKIAKGLFKKGMNNKDIAAVTGLTLKEIIEIAPKVKKSAK